MATTERDLLDRLVNPQGFSGTAALLGASFTPGVSTAVDAASALDAVRKRDPLNFGLSTLGLLPFISGTTVRVGGEAAGRGIKSLVENLYHGSPSLFNKFRKPRRSGMYGVGNYLTNFRKTAEDYAKKSTPSHFPRTNSDELGDPLGYIYNINVRAPESSFVDYFSGDLASQPKGLQDLYEELGIPDDFRFDLLEAVQSPDEEITRVAGKVARLARKSGFEPRGGLESLLQNRGVSGVKVDFGALQYPPLPKKPAEKYYVVFDNDLIDIIGEPTPVFPRRAGESSPGIFSSIKKLNQYLRNR